jgi:uncharacterized membrane protein
MWSPQAPRRRASFAAVDFSPDGRRLIVREMAWPLYMDAEIKPNRSLSERGFIILISVITLANVSSAIVFLKMHANVVPIFLGVDVLAVVFAFLASFRAGRVIERVQVSAAEVKVTYETPKYVRVVWESPTAFTRVTTERDEEDRVTALRLALSGRQTAVAVALSPRERGEFAKALEDAIWRAKRGEA